ncbi:MAG: DUF2780 domain-containing protein [Vibrio sp.]|uniref:DUF2780 domain-containing protein n=1 Tax=Vibrio sp. TaxID=678 RepID=UPI003A8A3825
MKVIVLIKAVVAMSAIAMSLSGCQSNSLTSSNSSNQLATVPTVTQTQQLLSLVNNTSSALGITQDQAVGSVTSLLSFAQSNLNQSSSSELTSLIGGVDLTSLSGSSSSVLDVTNSLSNLGLNASTLMQLAPLMLNYLKNQGASTSLLSEFATLFAF